MAFHWQTSEMKSGKKPLQSDDGTEYSHIPLHAEEQGEFNFVTVLNCKCGRMLGRSPEEWECTVPDRLVCHISQMRCEGWTNHLMQVKSSSQCRPDSSSQWEKQESCWHSSQKNKDLDQYNLLPIKGLNEIICLCETGIPQLSTETIHHPELLKSVLLAIFQIPGHF